MGKGSRLSFLFSLLPTQEAESRLVICTKMPVQSASERPMRAQGLPSYPPASLSASPRHPTVGSGTVVPGHCTGLWNWDPT